MRTFLQIFRGITEIFAAIYIFLGCWGIFAGGIVAESHLNPQATAYKNQSLGDSSLGSLVQWSFENPYWTLFFLTITIIGIISMCWNPKKIKEWREEHLAR